MPSLSELYSDGLLGSLPIPALFVGLLLLLLGYLAVANHRLRRVQVHKPQTEAKPAAVLTPVPSRKDNTTALGFTLAEIMRDEIMLLSTDSFQLLYLNKAARLAHGMVGVALKDRCLGDLFPADAPFDADALRENIAPLLAGTTDCVLRDCEWHGKSVEVSLQLEHGFDGTPRLLALVRDISKRKHAEKMRADFVATISHELRSPLTSIKGSLSLVAAGTLGDLPDRPRQLIEIAMRNSETMLRLINDLLDIERLDADRLSLKFETLDLTDFGIEALTANLGYGHEFGVKLRYIPPPEPLHVSIDRDAMRQVVTNLLSNAIKFSGKGKVVELIVTQHQDFARLTVKDYGLGIANEAQSAVFTRFFQAHSDHESKSASTGLGLSISKAITEKHGGKISFDSKVGVGTSFHVDLPLQEALRAAS